MSKISVINADTAFLRLMLEFLTDAGYEVMLHEQDGAIHGQLREESADLIVLDVSIEQPDSGWTLLELLRLDPATATIPIIVCSADVLQLRSKEQLLKELHCAILEKPFDLETLLSTISTMLGDAE